MRPRLLALSLLLSAAPLSTQPSAPVVVGDTVRLKSPGVSGKFHVTGLDADNLTLVWSEDTTQVVPISAIGKLFVLRGRHARVVSGLGGLGAGLLAGAIFGGIIGYGDGDPDTGFPVSPQKAAKVGAVVLGGIGGSVGLMMGLSQPLKKWERVPAATIRGGVSPSGGASLGLSLTIRF